MFLWIAALGAGTLAVWLTYPRFLNAPAPVRVAALSRWIGVTLIVGLLLNAVVGGAGSVPPLVALDVSQSWRLGADSAAFSKSRRDALALARDSVLAFGDSVRRASSTMDAVDLASSVRAVAERAMAAGRPLVVFTDGQLDDASALRDVPAGSRVEVAALAPRADAAVADVSLPAVAAPGDTVAVRVSVIAGAVGSGAGRLVLRTNGRDIVGSSTRIDSLRPFEERVLTVRYIVPLGQVAGDQDIEAALDVPGDHEQRNNHAASVLTVSGSAAAVLISTSPDLDAREIAAVLRGTILLPTRVYYRVTPTAWREDGALTPVSEDVVRRAMRQAPLVVVHGDTALLGDPRKLTAGNLALLTPSQTDQGEWFVTSALMSPISAAVTGTPWDSLPPLDVGASSPPSGAIELLETRRGRRLERRVAMWATQQGARRVVVAPASGFWRWRMRSNLGGDAMNALWGSILDWLSAEHSSARAIVAVSGTVRAGQTLDWRRTSAADSAATVTITRRGEVKGRSQRLPFAGASLAQSPALSEGIYEVRSAGSEGDSQLLAVNPPAELLPRRPTVQAGPVGSGEARAAAPRARDWSWLFGLGIVALCIEWVLRRRSGLR